MTVAISGHSGTDVSLSGETLTNDALTFTADNWNQAQTVTVNAGEDDDAADEAEVTLSHAVSGASEYAAIPTNDVPSVTVTITDKDTPGVSISKDALSLTEGGSGSYTVKLDTQPAADVTIDITGGGDVTTNPTQLVFTPTTWSTAQTVTVNAGADDDAADEAEVTLSHAVSGASEYQNVSAADVTVAVTDKDTAGVTISETVLTINEGGSDSYTVVLDTQPTAEVTVTISGHSGTDVSLSGETLSVTNTLSFTADNWNQAQTVTVNADEDDDAVDEAEVTLSHAVSGASEYQNVGATDVTVAITDKDSAGVSISKTELTITEGGSDSYTVVLDAQPTAEVTVTISGHSGTDITLSGETLANDVLTFSLDNWNQAQTVTVNAGEDDDGADEAEVTLSHAVSGASEYQNVGATDVTVAITDKDSAGVSISKTELTITEGGSDSYTVVLDAQPTAEVTVTISGHSGTDVSLSGETLANDVLTFSLDNWNQAQTVTVNAGEDDDGADEADVTLSHAVGGAGEYAAIPANDVPSVTVAITDKDSAGVSISKTELTITEGGSDSYTVVLTTRPSADVTVAISGHSGTDVRLSGDTLSPTNTLTFTPGNWATSHTVTVTAGEDDDAADETAVTLSHAVSGASEYAAIPSNDVPSVTVTVTDKDTAGVTISETALTITEGGSGSYTVVLDTRPTADVTVAISGHAGTDITLSGEALANDALTFTPGNWDQPQTVTLTAGDVSADTDVTLSHAVSGGGYGSVTAQDVSVTIVAVVEDRVTIQVGVTVTPVGLSVPEGGSETYEVVLSERPTGDVTLTVTVEDTANNDVSTDEASLVFTAENWNRKQTVTVRAAHDDDAWQDPAVSISHTVSGANYAGATVPGVSVTIAEDDTAGVSISETALTVTEGQSDTYTVVLDTQPTAVVTVAISGHSGTDITLSGETLSPTNTLTFTADNWNQAQTVTVNAGADDDAARRDRGDPEPRRQRGQRVPERQRRRCHRGHRRRRQRRGEHLRDGAHDHRRWQRQLHREAGYPARGGCDY